MKCMQPNLVGVFRIPKQRRQVIFYGRSTDYFRKVVLDTRDTKYRYYHEIPCGKCEACLQARSNQWALRMMLEYENSGQIGFFPTLTYEDSNVPKGGLSKRDVQLFMKRLRKKIGKVKIKYYVRGEYAPLSHRPHYHAIILGWCPPDMVYSHSSKRGNKLYYSDLIQKLWPHGIVFIGDCSFESCAYTAKYVNKVNKKGEQYTWENEDGYQRVFTAADFTIPEFSLSSQNLGYSNILDYYCEETNTIVYRGNVYAVPRSFADKYENKYKRPKKIDETDTFDRRYRQSLKNNSKKCMKSLDSI